MELLRGKIAVSWCVSQSKHFVLFFKSLPQTLQILERQAKVPSVPALYPLQVFRTVPGTGECYISVVIT